MSLIVATGVLTYVILSKRHGGNVSQSATVVAPIPSEDSASTSPWGDLVAADITLNAPEEYVAFDAGTNHAPTWTFENMTSEKASALMSDCGLSKEQVARAMALSVVDRTNVLVHPDLDLVLSFSPEVRSRFYTKLAEFPSNFYMQWPFSYPGRCFETCMEKTDLAPDTLNLIRKLLYPRSGAQFFSDYELLLRTVKTDKERIDIAEALTRQPAVLLRMQIHPDSDIDKILGYWGRGIQVKDTRPLLESLKRLESGGSISVLYLLPRFARDRLYTFPLPTKAGDPVMDCHWSTMNFFNDVPDNQLNIPAVVAAKLNSDYYRVAKPSMYGDIIIFLNERGDGIHSAVYIADNVVFTKNGNNFHMPWKLMRFEDLLAIYGTPNLSSRMQIYRNKKW